MFINLLFVCTALLIIAVLGWWMTRRMTPTAVSSAVTVSSAPTLEQIQALAELTTLRVEVRDTLSFHLDGHTGGATAYLVVHGWATLGVDLSQAQLVAVDAENRRLVLELPPPRLLSAALDQQRTQVVLVKSSGLWVMLPGVGTETSVLQHCLRKGEEVIRLAGESTELLDRAKVQTDAALQDALVRLNWKPQIRWTGP